MNLEEIYADYQELGLGGKNGTSPNFVPGNGPCPAKIMIIGEAPGSEEDRTRKPFQGPSGQILDRLLGFANIKREDVFVTNVFKYRPPRNRDPFSSEIVASLPCLSAEIKCVNPAVIILAGKVACRSVFPAGRVGKLRGRVIPKGERFIVCTYHPGVLLWMNSKSIESSLKADFLLAVEKAREVSD